MADGRIERVERRLAGRVICNRCGATLETYADQCNADLAERCPGFEAIERAGRLLDGREWDERPGR